MDLLGLALNRENYARMRRDTEIHQVLVQCAAAVTQALVQGMRWDLRQWISLAVVGKILVEEQQDLSGDPLIQRHQRRIFQPFPCCTGSTPNELAPRIADRIEPINPHQERFRVLPSLSPRIPKAGADGHWVKASSVAAPFLGLGIGEPNPLGVERRKVPRIQGGQHDGGGTQARSLIHPSLIHFGEASDTLVVPASIPATA
jgi:hypothetical protein